MDVLLNLIEEKKLEITNISLAEVTGQFIQYVESSDIPPGMIAEFLAVAARLLIIKTKALLPFLTLSEEEEEEIVDLELRLKLLQQFREGGKTLRKLHKKSCRSFGREGITTFAVTFYPPKNLETQTLHTHFKRIADEFHAFYEKQRYVEATLEKVISLEDRIREVMHMIEQAIEQQFDQLTIDAKSKTDIIVTFLAMLELIKQRLINVEQSGIFGQITIRRM
ncbi:MAG: ScpA family protein [bacterium]|nr:ScpA family protein [bacterium]